jgi:catechol 2,3-dioxygenase-like lactoylglutathione lyase family enzyme
MLIGGLFEVILYVRDMDAQVRFYQNVLGQAVSWPAGLADYSGEHWVAFGSGAVKFALHSGGEAPLGTPPRFGFSTEHIAEAREHLLKHGVPVSEVRSPAPGVQVVDCQDPEGNGFFIEQHG